MLPSQTKRPGGHWTLIPWLTQPVHPHTPHSAINLIFSIESSPPHITHYYFPSSSKMKPGTALVVQWLRIHLPMQGTGVQSLAQEDPTCRRATKSVREAQVSRVGPWHHENPPQSEVRALQESGPCSPQLEKAPAQRLRLSTAPNKISK